MTCDDFRNGMSDLIDGLAGDVERAAAEAHLRGCAECSSLLRRARFVVHALGGLSEAAPHELAERVLARVPRLPRRSSRWSEVRRVAGWGLVLLGLGWQLGGGALAAQAMTHAAPVLAEARQTVARTQKTGLTAELQRAEAGVTGLARGMRAARQILSPRETGRTTEDSSR